MFSGWIVRTSTSFRHESPIWLLGTMYTFNKSGSVCILFLVIVHFCLCWK